MLFTANITVVELVEHTETVTLDPTRPDLAKVVDPMSSDQEISVVLRIGLCHLHMLNVFIGSPDRSA